ncbi:hypothetical protein TNCV_1569441 [Trichonephila clavipes]|uniref:Uncharacterized protein n=1 Tax=Trichonephila clavipes TaxID=2585209 RepID=A0A8X6VP26_TRICX|nr:hypothetical protein TNCV_1569441 [Trichonephila clavipes]
MSIAFNNGHLALVKAVDKHGIGFSSSCESLGLNFRVDVVSTMSRESAPNKSPIMADKEILKSDKSSKNTVDGDSDDENEMNTAAPIPTSSEMMTIMKSMLSYLDTHSNGEMNNRINDI